MDNILYLNSNFKQGIDILLITGDLYIDHPSFGIAVIARLLENAGYQVAILSQPRYDEPQFLSQLPIPRLFIGITSGNLDSVVNNYSSNRNKRKKDAYSLDGNAFFKNGKRKRPDRALITYTALIKQKFKNIPVVLGGLEASLRRFVHYDYIQQKLRQSILLDSKADVLVYSMGERAILEIAGRLKKRQDLFEIPGTCIMIKPEQLTALKGLALPSWQAIRQDSSLLVQATQMIEANMIARHARPLYQDQGQRIIFSFQPQPALTQKELDAVYALPYQKDFPAYCRQVPAWQMIHSSITTHRGCNARCSFCAITSHQGPEVISRSSRSILNEARQLAQKKFFRKTITDIGGPTANMYGLECSIGWCQDPHCLFPALCPNLRLNPHCYLELLKEVKKTENVKNVFVSSGIRYDIALEKKEETEWIIRHATCGHLKIAPEHIDDQILKLMKKPGHPVLIRFIRFFNQIKKKQQLKFYLLPYLILSHPGSTAETARHLAQFLKAYQLKTYQYQDFTPTPQTLSTAMYYAKTSLTGESIVVPQISSQKNRQREILTAYLKGKK